MKFGDANELKKYPVKLRFKGYIGKREVVRSDYVVTFDCCHIALVAGERELVVGIN
ncbi:MAG TPA: hypothetical protein VNQ80_17855 [Parapedobacter sp.]|uniref:hypothetical protein n=1 Tax=Parapedobacter sp. TaxID=1958893 RepID=UPI002C983C0A|nr:hypothetical protein [Parapedobacter sp.]HWK59213.1 hypothetical protein [Parapedobacter sp.]